MARDTLHIEIKTMEQVSLMRRAGLVVADVLAALRDAVAPGVTTADLDAQAEERIKAFGAFPSFKGYHGYPACICASVNDQVVHGIPSMDQVLREGDIISLDCGAELDGWHADAAITVGVGEISPASSRLICVAESALWAGISAAARGARSGKGRLTDISFAIHSAITRRGRWSVIEEYGGHGIGSQMHQDPFVFNVGRPGQGPRLITGLVLALEPMVTMGKPAVVELDDGWTVVTTDGSLAAHAEHTVALCDDGVWVLTAHDGGRARLGNLVTSRQPAVAI